MISKVIQVVGMVACLYFVVLFLTFYYPWKEVSTALAASDPPFPDNSSSNLFWFIQVSDIHISIHLDPSRAPDFKDFCQETIGVIDPDLVLVTGDLTDAKSKDRYASMQLEPEWIIYNNILQSTQVTKNYTWIDIRGNHDAFDVMSLDANKYFLKYSGDKGRLAQSTWTLKKSFGNYSFIHVDGTLLPGPRRPFNFMGHLSQKKLEHLYNEGQKATHSNFTFWYGHYPSSTMTYGSMYGLRSIIGEFGDVFLNGHLHSLHGATPILYALNPSGFLELEVKDWMDNRYYRIVAVDHDLMSFVDVAHRDWPVVLITNPKPATFMIPNHEPISRLRNSTHIRFLVFSPSPVQHLSISIDDVKIDETPKHLGGPLWACRWNPKVYIIGMHKLVVKVRDSDGRSKIAVSEFSLEDTWTTNFTWRSMLILLTDICTVVQVVFVALAAISLTVLVFIKYCGVARSGKVFFKLHLLILDDITFLTLLIFFVNILLGPMFVGELFTDHVGICFSYGLLIDGKLTREYLTYVFCLVNLLLSYLPLAYYLSHCADLRWAAQFTFRDSLVFTRRNIFANCCFLMHSFYHYRMAWSLLLSYGRLAVLLSPAYAWWFIATLFLTARTWRRPIVTRNSS